MLKSELIEILSDVEDVLTDDSLSDSEKVDEVEAIMFPEDEEEKGSETEG